MEPAEFTLRAARAEDLPAVRHLLVTTWHDTYDAIFGPDKVTEITDAWHALDRLAAQLHQPETSFLVADMYGAIVGHVFADASRPPILALSRLYVLPGYQRRGIGAALLTAALGAHPEAQEVSLEVAAENTKALAFYAREGFEPAGRASEGGLCHTRLRKRLGS